MAKPVPTLLPVLHDVPKCREWAGGVGSKAGYRPPIAPIWTRRLDSVFLHPVAGPLVFLLVVVGVIRTIFMAAAPIYRHGDEGVRASAAIGCSSVLPDSLLTSLVVDGAWRGVGSVLVFLPQVLLLFLFIGILEDSGYLARAALIADRTMARVGLQGKSFIPLLSAYGCAVPAIMSTRTIENKRDRIATILIAPFMTCSARLPVYALLIAAFIPDRNLLGSVITLQVAALLGLYVLGFLAAVVTARLLKSSVLKSAQAPFLLEMPSYRWPTLQSLGLRLLDRSKVFLQRAGHGHPAGDRGPLGDGAPALHRRQGARHREQPGGNHRPHHRAPDQAAGLQLEDRHRPDHFAGRARNHHRHPGRHLRHGPGLAGARICRTPCGRI